MFGINHWELLIIFGIILLLFGKKLPGAMRSLGLSFTEFKKGIQGVEEDPDKDERDAPKSDRPASTPSA